MPKNDFEDFWNAVSTAGVIPMYDDWVIAFMDIDTDDDGKIDAAEINAWG